MAFVRESSGMLSVLRDHHDNDMTTFLLYQGDGAALSRACACVPSPCGRCRGEGGARCWESLRLPAVSGTRTHHLYGRVLVQDAVCTISAIE